LVGVLGVLDQQGVQVELFLQVVEQGLIQLVQAPPHKGVGLLQYATDFVEADVATTLAVEPIGDAIDDMDEGVDVMGKAAGSDICANHAPPFETGQRQLA
jgi:hypothetical protein